VRLDHDIGDADHDAILPTGQHHPVTRRLAGELASGLGQRCQKVLGVTGGDHLVSEACAVSGAIGVSPNGVACKRTSNLSEHIALKLQWPVRCGNVTPPAIPPREVPWACPPGT
jgi:hypothetical protein